MGVIYKISSPSGRVYVGKTKNLKRRIKDYRWKSKNRKSIIHDSIKGYGWDAHKLEIIEEIANELLNDREVFWIKELNTFYLDNEKGMNMTRGGDGNKGSWMHNTELRKWFSNKFSGKGNPFYGKTHSEETRKQISELMSERNKKEGITIPKWGAEKGRLKVIKAVLMYDLEGNFIAEFESCTAAAKHINSKTGDVSVCANGKRTQAKGYVFRYKTDNYPLKIDVGVVKKQTVKRPIITVLSGKMWQHPSAKEASEFFGIPKTTINRAAMYNNGRPIRSGYTFYYKN